MGEDRTMSASTMAYAALAAAIAFEVAGTTLLQKSEQFTRVAPTLGMAACYAAAFFLMSVALKAMPLGVVYAIWSGVGIVVTALIGALLFKQHLDLPAMVGIAMIVGGVVVMQAFSATAGH
jgi:small multidrug resistance pump